jgi:hypothetical protein
MHIGPWSEIPIRVADACEIWYPGWDFWCLILEICARYSLIASARMGYSLVVFVFFVSNVLSPCRRAQKASTELASSATPLWSDFSREIQKLTEHFTGCWKRTRISVTARHQAIMAPIEQWKTPVDREVVRSTSYRERAVEWRSNGSQCLIWRHIFIFWEIFHSYFIFGHHIIEKYSIHQIIKPSDQPTQ